MNLILNKTMPPIYPQPKCIKRQGSAYSAKCDCISCIFRKPWRADAIFNKKILKKGLRGKLDKICIYKPKISAKK